MTARYAAGTTVPVGRTRDEIERILSRYGAGGFMFGQDRHTAAVAFTLHNRHVRFRIPLPDPDDPLYTETPGGKVRADTAARAAWEQSIRARWRALGLIVKAKLEAVEAGVVEFDVEFMANLVMPDGRTVGEAISEQLADAIDTGTVPALLPGGGR